MGDDEIVMTPLQGSVRGKVIRIARVPKSNLVDANVQHFAGGPYKGIVINKAANEVPDPGEPETERAFTAVIGDANHSTSREWRELRFWFQPDTRAIPQVRDAITDTFFKELMDPKSFPKEYIMFMKKLLVLLKQYSAISRIEVEFRPLNPDEQGPTTIRKRKQIVRASVIGGVPNGGGKGNSHQSMLQEEEEEQAVQKAIGQVPSQEDIKVLLYSDDVRQEQLEETLFAAGFVRSAPQGGAIVRRPGYRIQEDIQVIIRQEINAGNTLEQALYNAGYVPAPGRKDDLFIGEGRTEEDIHKLLYNQTLPIDQLNVALAEAGFVRAPGAVYMKQPGTRAQEDIKAVLHQEMANGYTLEEALYTAGYVPSADSGPSRMFSQPGASQDDIQKLMINQTTTVDDLDLALEEAGFVKAPPVGVVLRYPGARGEEDLKKVLQNEVTQGTDLQQALYTAGFIPNPKHERGVFAAPRRSQDDVQQMLVKDTLTFDQLNVALEEAGYIMAPGIGASLKYPGMDRERDTKTIVCKEVEKGVQVERALWNVGYVPNTEAGSAPIFSAPGRSEEDIKEMLYRTELNVQLFNTAIQEAGFVPSRFIAMVTVQPGARCGEDLRVVLREETSNGVHVQEALFISGYVPKPDIGDRLWQAEGYGEEDILLLLKKQDLALEELEVAIYEAGFYRPPGLSVANRTHLQEDVRFTISRSIEEGATLEEALFKAGYVKAPTKGVTVKRAPTISRKGWEMLWKSKKSRLLQILEDAYPNVMSTENLIKVSEMKRNNVERLTKELLAAGSIQELTPGNWMCVHAVPAAPPVQEHKARTESMIARGESSDEEDVPVAESPEKRHDIKMVTHIPQLPKHEQPTIAVVTLLFCEKLAVDAMMSHRTTYIRYKVEGEGQVYTVGMIGKHRIVATKLARIGMKQDAMIAAGNTITRLLGTFGDIEHVILVGVGGGVRDDPNSSLRLGDIVVSRPHSPRGPLYVHCADAQQTDAGKTSFMTQEWKPQQQSLQELIDALENDPALEDWKTYKEEAMKELCQGQTSFNPPPPETDKFYKPGDEQHVTQVHYGAVGSGKGLNKDDELRRRFAAESGCSVIDSGFQAVMQSIEGNRTETFAVIRGISDYRDGTLRREWQPYAALVAAAYFKTLVLQIPTMQESDED